MSTTNHTAQDPRHLRVFLTSPGDAAEERKLALQVLWDLQHDPFLRGQVTLESVTWDYPPGGVPMVGCHVRPERRDAESG